MALLTVKPIMQDVKLLIVDDDEDDYLIVEDLLDEITHGEYHLDWAPSFEAGENLLRANQHDLCLMDYKLGARDGIELLKRAQDVGFSGPIILLTGMHQGEVDMQALEAGAVDYLVKSNLTAEQLARSVRYALARREVEKERVERLKAEAENRSKSDFLAHLSHEIRTPLSAILGYTELLINRAEDAETLAHLRVVNRNGKHLLGLLNDVLDLSKIEAGKLDIDIQKVHLASLLTDTYAMINGAAADKSLQLQVEVLEPLPREIETDPVRLRQVLINLLGNAIKFTDRGLIKLKVDLTQDDGREMIRFYVRDTGIGISPDAVESIFQPFVQSKGTVTHTRAGGTGLGLTISRQLVSRLGGDIHVESEPGRGSEFVFTVYPGDLRGVERRKISLDFHIEREMPDEVPSLQGRVLVVDDLHEIRALVGHFVEVAGVEVEFAKNGQEAVELTLNERSRGKDFDLVLMDIHMPVMGGIDAAKLLREQHYDKPLIALTAAHMKGDEELYLSSGFTAFLGKPIGQQRLHKCLSRFLPANAPASRPDSGRGSVSAGTVLVVEDAEDALQATCGLLGLLGWETLTAISGGEALECLRANKPNKALVDLHLPDMDGYDLAQQIAELSPMTEIFILSGEAIDAKKAAEIGIAGSLLKPVSLQALEGIMHQSHT